MVNKSQVKYIIQVIGRSDGRWQTIYQHKRMAVTRSMWVNPRFMGEYKGRKMQLVRRVISHEVLESCPDD